MWNTFDQCKNAIRDNYNSYHFRKGLPEETLKEKVWEIAEKYKKISTSRAKAECIVYILRNAEIDILPEDIFAVRINHGKLMESFLASVSSPAEIVDARRSVKEYETKNILRANMDFGHVAPDWNYILTAGIPGIIADLESCSKHTPYYSERIAVYQGIQEFCFRLAELAYADYGEKGRFIAGNLRHIAVRPPETLAQAMQLILLFYVLQMQLDTVCIRSLGGLDRMLAPFFRKDLESRRFTEKQLREVTKYFLWECSCMKTTANLPFYICGMDENGQDATNEFTYFLLEIYRELDLYDPKVHVMYHKDMSKKVLRLLLEMIREGKNSFVFINTEIASRALEKIGISAEDAKKVIVYGCYETAAEGTEIPCTCGGMINLAKAVELVMAEEKEYTSFEEFYRAVIQQLESYTTLCMDTITVYEKHYPDICPSMFMSPTFRQSRENGIDVYEGGAKYNNTSIVGAGLATLVDSLIVMKKMVFDEKRTAYKEFRQILCSDWQQDEHLRLLVKKKYPKFGNHTGEADEIARDVFDRFAACINGRNNGRGGVFRCGMFSVDWRYWMGETTGATPDGRYAGEPLSKNLAASIGQDKNGVTAYLRSVLELDGTKTPDGYVADVVLHFSAVKDEEGMAAFESLLTTYMKKGGFAVHFNILNPEMLVEAQKEPEKYQNLQIRICGWNVRFVDLDKAQQDEFIKQSVNCM